MFVLSFFGLPWVCGATVQSLNHVRSMANVRSISEIKKEMESEKEREKKKEVEVEKEVEGVESESSVVGRATLNEIIPNDPVMPIIVSSGMNDKQKRISDVNSGKGNGGGSDVFSDVIETRLTGFVIHASILFSLLLLPFLGNIPIPVISGIFLYLGKKMMKGNLFLERLGCIIIEKKLLPSNNVFNLLPSLTVIKYLTIQSFMLLLIWVMKQNRNFSLFFPSCIAFLMIVRTYVMPNFFSKNELLLLDPAM